MDLPSNTSALLENASSKSLYVAVINQLNKDFALANLSYEVPSNFSPEALKDSLEKVLLELLKTNYDGYLNLIYRVDVPESDLMQIQGGSLDQMSEQLTYVVLKRIYKKVWFRSRL